MTIMTEKDITGAVARELRLKRRMTQDAFWGPIYRQKKQASDYERSNDKPLPDTIRMLVYIRYYLGFDYDISTPEGAKAAIKAMQLIKGQGFKSLEQEVEKRDQKLEDTVNDVNSFIDEQIFQLLEMKKSLQPAATTREKKAKSVRRTTGRSKSASGEPESDKNTGDQAGS